MTRWIAGFVCAIALTAAGCGGAPEPARPAEPPAATPAPTPTPTPDALRRPRQPKSPRHQPRRPRRQPRSRPPRRPQSRKARGHGKACRSAAKYGPGVYAHITTNHGAMIARLFDKEAPKTVENFVMLAEGKKQWRNPRTNTMVRRPYYNNLTFHRIIPGFMIQGGDPEGTGMGGPGFDVRRRIQSEAAPQQGRHPVDGEQQDPTPTAASSSSRWCRRRISNDRHSVFGELVEGMDTLMAIGKVPTGANRQAREAGGDQVGHGSSACLKFLNRVGVE